MATNGNKKPSASKTTKRVTANNFFAGIGNGQTKKTTSASKTKHSGKTKSVAKTAGAIAVSAGAVKAIKKLNGKSMLTVILCFIIALGIGVGACFLLGRNDKFEMNGEEHVSLQIGETYTDDGVEIVEFGLNLSKNATIETDLQRNENGEFYSDTAGDFYIAYTIKSLKFGLIYPVQKIRLVSVTGESEGGE